MTARREPRPEDLPFGKPATLPYLMGVYLAVNAIRDAWLVVDGPDCSHFKGQYIAGKHDWYSTLYRTDGRHRVLFTGTNAQNVTGNRDRLISRTIRKALVDEAGAVLLTSMPLCGITGAQYDRIIDGIGATRPVVEIPGLSLRGDWLDGFAETLRAIAARKVWRGTKLRARSVAIVGHLMDRNEGDQTGNLAELGRLVGALGLDLVSVWPDGGSWADLDRVAAAGTIVSLPFGREAARMIAERTGARLVETGLPIGIEGTRRWVEAVAESCGRAVRGRKIVAAETDRVAARVGPVIPFYFLNRSVAIFAEPHHLAGLAGLCTDLGMRVRFAAALGSRSRAPDELAGGTIAGVPVRHDFLLKGTAYDRLHEAGIAPGDMVVCTSEIAQYLGRSVVVVEFGVPSFTHHLCADDPFLGFEGALRLVGRMANALAQSPL